jgi:hypothetical protein
MGRLLAIDLGLHSGLALFDMADGTLIDWRTHTFPDRTRFKAGVHALVERQGRMLDAVVAEGDPKIARVWAKELRKLGLVLEVVSAEDWRRDVLLPRERRDRSAARAGAVRHAERIIAESDAGRTAQCTPEAAEAICLGRWALQRGIDDGGWTDP